MRILTVFVGALLIGTPAEALDWSKVWKGTIGVFAGAQATDIETSIGKNELNPALGRGQFGVRQALIKVSISSALPLVQYIWIQRANNPEKLYKAFSFINIGAATATGAVAYRNSTFPKVR